MSENPSPPAAPEQKSLRNDRRRRVALIVAAVLGVIALAVGLHFYVYSRSHKSTDDAFIAGNITFIAPRVTGHVLRVPVEDNQQVKEGDLLAELDPADYEAALAVQKGMLASAEAKLQAARAALKLTTITAYAGQDEAASGVKFSESAVETARTRMGVAKTQLDQARAALSVAKAAEGEARADVRAAGAQAEFDATDLKRNEQMFKGGAITEQQMDKVSSLARISEAQVEMARKKLASAEAKVIQAEAAVKGAEDGLRQARSMSAEAGADLASANAREKGARSAPERVGVDEAQVHAAAAEVERAKAAVRSAELALSYTRVRAPRAGRVTNKTVRAGAFVQTGQALLTIVPADIWIVANFKETDLTRIAPGQPVTISVDAYPDAEFTGRVDSIQAGTGAVFSLLPPENASGNYIKVVQRVPVKIVFDPAPDMKSHHLAPGMSVVPTVNVSARPKRPGAAGEPSP